MNAFDSACEVEREGMPFLQEHYERYLRREVFWVPSGRGCPIAKRLQVDLHADGLYVANGKVCRIDAKIESEWTGRLFLETWSNKSEKTPGWLFAQPAKNLEIAYLFVDRQALFVLSLTSLQSWAVTNGLARFHPVKQGRREQKNDTWGRVVPVAVLRAEVGFLYEFNAPAEAA